MPRAKTTEVTLSFDEVPERQDDTANYLAKGWPIGNGWVIAFSLRLANTGDTTIRGAKINVVIERPAGWDVGWNKAWIAADARKPAEFELPRGKRLYPAETLEFPDGVFLLRTNELEPVGPIRLLWKVFLDNAQPCTGSVDLTPFAQEHIDRLLASVEDDDVSDE